MAIEYYETEEEMEEAAELVESIMMEHADLKSEITILEEELEAAQTFLLDFEEENKEYL